MRYPWYLRVDLSKKQFDDNPLGVLWRYTINLRTGDVSEATIDDLGTELPRIDDLLVGHTYNYSYAAVQPTNEEIKGAVKYNLKKTNVRSSTWRSKRRASLCGEAEPYF